jgi:hypothetical protein
MQLLARNGRTDEREAGSGVPVLRLLVAAGPWYSGARSLSTVCRKHFFQRHECKIIAQWLAIAVIAIRIGIRLSGSAISLALIPGDERPARVDHGHANALASMVAHPLFGFSEQRFAKSTLLLRGVHGERAEIPGSFGHRLKPDAAAQFAFCEPLQEPTSRLGGYLVAQENEVCSIALQICGFVMSRRRARASIGPIQKVDKRRNVGIDDWLKHHISPSKLQWRFNNTSIEDPLPNDRSTVPARPAQATSAALQTRK